MVIHQPKHKHFPMLGFLSVFSRVFLIGRVNSVSLNSTNTRSFISLKKLQEWDLLISFQTQDLEMHNIKFIPRPYIYVYHFWCFYVMNKRRYKDCVSIPPTQSGTIYWVLWMLHISRESLGEASFLHAWGRSCILARGGIEA